MDVKEGKMKKNVKGFARFVVVTVVNIKMIVVWDMALYRPIEIYQHYMGTCCFHPSSVFISSLSLQCFFLHRVRNALCIVLQIKQLL
jgi:hypothetical protein